MNAQLGLRPARAASTSSQDWKRAGSVDSAHADLAPLSTT
jgi:hypothetical protein